MTVFSKRTCFFYPLIRPFSLRYKGFHYGKILCVLFVYLILEILEYSTASGLVIYQFCKAKSANERSRHKKKKRKRNFLLVRGLILTHLRFYIIFKLLLMQEYVAQDKNLYSMI